MSDPSAAGRDEGLSSDAIRDGLGTRRLGCRIHLLDEVGSTQDVARDLAASGAPNGTLVVAERQTGGRGRLSRSFFSPRGGIWCSLLLRPPWPAERLPLLSLAAGLACAEAIAGVSGLSSTLKWPNDVLLNGRKVSGILAEATFTSEAVESVILGIGINVNVPAEQFPVELRQIATSLLAEAGRPVQRASLLRRLLERLEEYEARIAADPTAVVAAWRAAPNMLGTTVEVSAGDEQCTVRAVDLDETGALLVLEASGARRRFLAADVRLGQLAGGP